MLWDLWDLQPYRFHGKGSEFADVDSRATRVALLKYYNISFDSQCSLNRLRERVYFVVSILQGTDEELETNVENDHSLISNNSEDRRTRIREEWPHELSESSKKSLILAFKKETLSFALRKINCACCAERVFTINAKIFLLRISI